MRIGNRIPSKYFVTSGVGESDITQHAGSFHLALRQAGIEMANIVGYSSILPGGLLEIAPEEYHITHGEVLETIMAVAQCDYGETCTAGLIWGWLHNVDGERYGGLVCEYNGSLPPGEAKPHLEMMLNELWVNGYEHLEMSEISMVIRHIAPEKRYGAALVALCFTEHTVPVLQISASGDVNGSGERLVL